MRKLPDIMGVLNVTPDSFSDTPANGGRLDTVERAVARARVLVDEGATVLDIGGESTRPGAAEVSVTEELERVVPAVRAVRAVFADADVEPVISVDTRKPDVAQAAIVAGADVWNDVSALSFSSQSVDVAADLGCDLVLMHAQGTPDTMQDAPRYRNAVSEIAAWLEGRLRVCDAAGIDRARITLDPGIGFGKRLPDNLDILARLDAFTALGCRVLVGASRKSFIGKLDGSAVDDRLGGSIASAVLAWQNGADVVRVHDVAQTRQALIVAHAVAERTAATRTPHT